MNKLRSKYIYIITDIQTDTPVIAFTYKHDLAEWLYRQNPQQYAYWRGWRMRDGRVLPGKVEAPLPLNLMYLRSEGEKIVAQRTVVNRTWE
jgi:hypothetical protein